MAKTLEFVRVAAAAVVAAGCSSTYTSGTEPGGGPAANGASGSDVGTSTGTLDGTGGEGAATGSSTSTGEGGASTSATSMDVPVVQAVEQPLRRLSHFEYGNTLRDLLPSLTIAPPQLAAEETIDGFSNHWDVMQPSALLSEQYYSVALSVARQLDGAAAEELAGCADGSCARDFVESFGRRAFRRPLETDEVDAFLAVFDTGPGASDFTLGVQLVVMAMLQSPQFLYRPELGVGEVVDERGKRLSGYETASRLSYLLWASMPDDELLDAAGAGSLDDPAEVASQARRLLDDSRARDGVGRFFSEWLDAEKLNGVTKNAEVGWDTALRGELVESFVRFAYDEVFEGGGTSADLLTATRFPMTAGVAAAFGVDAPSAEWQSVETDPNERSGLLTHPAFLGAHGYGDYGSPVLRGVYVLGRILCTPPTPPPAGVAIVLPEAPDAQEEPRTNREAYTQATTGAGCVACHASINAYGFAFENYDTLGAYRTVDNGFDVDASGSVGDLEFEDGVSLSRQLAESDAYRACIVSKWASYALGGSPLASDRRFLFDLQRALTDADDSLEGFLVALATHERFAHYLATAEATP